MVTRNVSILIASDHELGHMILGISFQYDLTSERHSVTQLLST